MMRIHRERREESSDSNECDKHPSEITHVYANGPHQFCEFGDLRASLACENYPTQAKRRL
jgi:hypothetical protein